MLKYSDFVLDIFYNPAHAGTIKGYYGMGRFKDVQQDEDLKIFVVITNEKISDIRYQTSGSIISHVALSVLSEIAVGKTIDEASAISVHDLLKRISQVPKSKFSCLPSAIECLKVALKNANKRKETMKEFSSDIVTKNFGTTTKITRIEELQKQADELSIALNQEPLAKEELAEDKKQKVKREKKDQEPKLKKSEKPVKAEKIAQPKVAEEKEVKPVKQEKVSKKEAQPKISLSVKQEKGVQPKVAEQPAKKEEPVAKPVQKQADPKTEKYESTPTKIEIRVVEEPSSEAEELTPEQEFVASKTKQKAKTKKVSAKPTPKKEPKKEEVKEEKSPAQNTSPLAGSTYNSIFKIDDKTEPSTDELADEIDTITAKLTDAISKLNFKFDDDDTIN